MSLNEQSKFEIDDTVIIDISHDDDENGDDSSDHDGECNVSNTQQQQEQQHSMDEMLQVKADEEEEEDPFRGHSPLPENINEIIDRVLLQYHETIDACGPPEKKRRK